MWHVAHSIHPLPEEAEGVTEQCSGNITKTLVNFCLARSLPLSPPPPSPPPLSPPPLMSRSQQSEMPESHS